jgi:hypothetical protein
MEFNIPLQEEKIKPHQVTTLHMVCAMAFLGTGSIIAIYNYTIPGWGLALLLEGILLAGMTMFRNRTILDPKNNLTVRIIEFITAVVVVSYSFFQHWKVPEIIFGVLTASLAFAIFWERSKGEILYVNVSDDGISLPVTSRKRFVEWKEVENVVLRYGTLSVNCVDDRLFQWTTLPHSYKPLEIEQFSEEQVEKHKQEKEEDW